MSLDQILDAEHAVQKAATNIPAEVCGRFEIADKLSDEDRNTIIEIVREALAPFQPKQEAKAEAEATAGLKPERTSRAKPNPKSKPALEPKAKAEHGGAPKPDAPTGLTAEATDKS